MRAACMRSWVRVVSKSASSVSDLHAQPLSSLDELVKDSINGLVFYNAEQLAAQLEVRVLPPSCAQCTD